MYQNGMTLVCISLECKGISVGSTSFFILEKNNYDIPRYPSFFFQMRKLILFFHVIIIIILFQLFFFPPLTVWSYNFYLFNF